MNCNLCKHELEAYHEGRLPEGIRVQIQEHLDECSGCATVYQLEVLANRVIDEEKSVQPNPFLATRIMAQIEAQKQSRSSTELIPLYRRALKPALVTLSLAAAVLAGVLTGSIYKPASQQKVPVELTYINDAALESVELLSNN